jgi:hypothetical protein
VPQPLITDNPTVWTLPRACVELNRRYGVDLTQERLYRLVTRAAVPSHYLRGRWYISPADLPAIAATVKAALAAPSR